jgi:hypothetical protein
VTLEQAVSKWLAERLDRKIETVVTQDAVSAVLADYQTVDKWVAQSQIVVTIFLETKIAAATLTQTTIDEIAQLKRENGIASVDILALKPTIEDNPSYWKYTFAVAIRHRRRSAWQL